MANDSAGVTSSGRLFHVCRPATNSRQSADRHSGSSVSHSPDLDSILTLFQSLTVQQQRLNSERKTTRIGYHSNFVHVNYW